ncbi:MAG: hypothetical protein H6700_02415 [Myxococcales bacterium]|nr:hypothetical protein [Myxococcales bacterium]
MNENLPKKFNGRETHSVDAKGRMTMPSRFREIVLESSSGKDAPILVVVPWFGECVRVFPINRWRSWVGGVEEALVRADAFGYGEDESDLRRLLYGLAQEVAMDGFGRFVLPQHVREGAGVLAEACWLGLGDFMEIWSPERLDARLGGENARRLRALMVAISARPPAEKAAGDATRQEVNAST